MTTVVLLIYVICQLTLVVARRDVWLLVAVAIGILSEGALVAIHFSSSLISVPYVVFSATVTASLVWSRGPYRDNAATARTSHAQNLIAENPFLVAWIGLAGVIAYQMASNRPLIGVVSGDIALYVAIASISITTLLSRSHLCITGAIVLGIGATGLLAGSIASERDFQTTIIVILAAGILVGHYLGELTGGRQRNTVGD